MPTQTTQYTKEELWKIFEKLPSELKDAIFSQETADIIWNTSERNGLSGEQMHSVAGFVGNSLMGLLHPNDLAQTFVEKAGLSPKQALNVSKDINRFIMFPLKNYLYEFYKNITFVPGEEVIQKISPSPQTTTSPSHSAAQNVSAKPVQNKTVRPQGRADMYRESIE